MKHRELVMAVATPQRSRRNLKVKKDIVEGKISAKKELVKGRRRDPQLRSFSDKASRAVSLKLASFPQQQVRNNKNNKNEKIVDVVTRELTTLAAQKKNLSLAFWEGIIKDFDLVGGWAEDIPKPVKAESVNKELNAALMAAHAANPAARSSTRLIRYLLFAAPANETELSGLLLGAGESPSCSKSMASTLSEAVLLYLGRTAAHEAHPKIWESVQTHFDSLMVQLWQKSQARGHSRSQFMRTWRAPLGMFMNMAHAVMLNESFSSKSEAIVDEKVLDVVCKSSLIAAELFAPESSKLEVQAWIDDISSRIQELQQQDFDLDEIDCFKKIMQHQAESLDDNIIDNLAEAVVKIRFLDAPIERPLINVNDQWSMPWKALVKATAISLGKVKRLPWECYVYGDTAPLPDCRTVTNLDESLFFDCANAREFLSSKLLGWVTAETCKKTIKKYAVDLHKMDSEWFMEETYLMDHYDDAILQRARMLMCELLPKAGERRSLQKAVTASRQLAIGPLVCAQRKALVDEMSSAATALLDIASCQAPTAPQLAKMTDWLQAFHRQAANFFHIVAEDAVKDDERKKKNLFGEDAMRWRMQQCIDKGDAVQDGDHLKEFRMWAFLLTPEDAKKVKEWQRVAVGTSKLALATMRQKALKDVEDEAAQSAKKARADPKKEKPVVAPPLGRETSNKAISVTETASKEAAVDDEDEGGENLGLMGFFGSRAL